MKPVTILILLALLAVPLSGGAVLAQEPTPTEKPPPPPTPTPEPPTATPLPPPPTPAPTVPPTATEKPPAPPTPTPPLPTATPLPPTGTPPPTQESGGGASSATPTAPATPAGPTATRSAALPSPTATPSGAGATVEGIAPTATATLTGGLPGASVGVQQGESEGETWSTSGETGGLGGWLRSLPPWGPWAGGLALLAVAAFGTWLVTRFVSYTARDIRLKERMLARDAQANITDLNTALRQLGQLAFDATGIAPGIDQVTRVIGAPVPAILTLGRDYLLYVFTPAPSRTFREHQQALVGDGTVRDRFRIDARTSGPTVVYELARVWEIVAEAGDVPLPQRALPRARQWWLYVVKPG